MSIASQGSAVKLSIYMEASRCAWIRIMILTVHVSTTVFITQR